MKQENYLTGGYDEIVETVTEVAIVEIKSCCELAAYFGVACATCAKAKTKFKRLDATKPVKAPKAKNLCRKTRPKNDPYEVWATSDGKGGAEEVASGRRKTLRALVLQCHVTVLP